MTKAKKWWLDHEKKDLPIDDVIKELESISPANAYFARQIARLFELDQQKDEEITRMQALIFSLKELLLRSGTVEEEELDRRIENALLQKVVTRRRSERETQYSDEERRGRIAEPIEETIKDIKKKTKERQENRLEQEAQAREQISKERSALEETRLKLEQERLELERIRLETASFAAENQQKIFESQARFEKKTDDSIEEKSSEKQVEKIKHEDITNTDNYEEENYRHNSSHSDHSDSYYDFDYSTGSKSKGIILGLIFLLAIGGGIAFYFVNKKAKTLEATKEKRALNLKSTKETPATKPTLTKSNSSSTKPVTSRPTKTEQPNARFTKLLNEAKELHQQGKLRLALKALSQAHAHRNNSVEAIALMAWIHYTTGKHQIAEKEAHQALKADKNSVYAILALAALAHEQNKKQEAKNGYQRFLKLCPKCKEAKDIQFALQSIK